MEAPQYFHFVFISELEDDRLVMRRHSMVHLCAQLKAKVNRCPFHGKETRTGRSNSKPSTSSGMVYPARCSASRIAPSERISLSTGSPSFLCLLNGPLPASPSPSPSPSPCLRFPV